MPLIDSLRLVHFPRNVVHDNKKIQPIGTLVPIFNGLYRRPKVRSNAVSSRHPGTP
jgi:hypothetical protein